MLSEAQIKRIVTRTLNAGNYREEEKPKLNIVNCGYVIVVGGCGRAREGIENALNKHIVSTQNYPTKTIITLD